jgi:translation initiation factor 6
MPVARVNFGRLPYLGVFALATDTVAIVPSRFAKGRVVLETLGVPIVKSSVSKSPLIGIFAAGNSNGLVVSELLDPEEEKMFKDNGLKIVKVPGKFTALGNMVLANDNGALVSVDFPREMLPMLKDALGVQTEYATIAGLKNVGAAAVATNKGVLVHPDIRDDEINLVKSVLRVPVDVGTACSGIKYIGICVVANSHGAITGENTTGPELGRIESALGFI